MLSEERIKQLEEELKKAKEEAWRKRFLERMKEIGAQPTGFICKFCKKEIWIDQEDRGFAHCGCFGPWGYKRLRCFICGKQVGLLIYDRGGGYEYRRAPTRTFKIHPYEVIEVKDFREFYVCDECKEKPEFEIAKECYIQKQVVERAEDDYKYAVKARDRLKQELQEKEDEVLRRHTDLCLAKKKLEELRLKLLKMRGL